MEARKLRKSTYGLYKKACELDINLCVERESVDSSAGHTREYLEHLGLDKGTLVRLERAGRAIRAYTRNYWESGMQHPQTGEVIPMGRMQNGVEYKIQYRGKGSRVRWIILKDTA